MHENENNIAENETSAIRIEHTFKQITHEDGLRVAPNAEFAGINRAPLGKERAGTMFAELGVPANELESRSSYEEIVFIHGEPNAVIAPHIHERTPTFVLCVDGSAEVNIGDQIKSFTKSDLIDFPMGESHSLKMGPEGCLFIACSEHPVVDGDKVIDITLLP